MSYFREGFSFKFNHKVVTSFIVPLKKLTNYKIDQILHNDYDLIENHVVTKPF